MQWAKMAFSLATSHKQSKAGPKQESNIVIGVKLNKPGLEHWFILLLFGAEFDSRRAGKQ